MAIDVRTFETEIRAEYDKKVRGLAWKVAQTGLTGAFTYIMQNWPIWTGYSGSNNYVTENAPVEIPEPEFRPWQERSMENDFYLAYDRGLTFIAELQPHKTKDILVYISNPVDYAADFGGNYSNGPTGEQIYANAVNLFLSETDLLLS